LRKLHASVEALIHHRKELTQTTGAFAKSAAMLGNCEEHTSLSCALSQLAETEEKIEQLYSQQVDNDFFYLAELLKDYIALIGAVKDVFHQRVKVFQTWQHSIQTLTKKREIKAKLELALKTDKVSQANEEVIEVLFILVFMRFFVKANEIANSLLYCFFFFFTLSMTRQQI